MGKGLGRGSKIYYGSSSTGPWTKVPQVESIGEIRKTSPKVPVTDLESVAEEYLSGLPDPGTISLAGFWDATNAVHQQIDTDQRAGTALYYKVEVYRAGALHRTGVLQGYWAEFGSGPFENKTPVKANAVIQMSGDVTWS